MATDTRKAKLQLSIETLGASEAAKGVQQVSTSATTLQKELTKLTRNDEIDKLAIKFGLVAKKTKDATTAAAELEKELLKINATEGEIQGAAGTFQSAQSGNIGGGSGLARFGSQLRALPSTQIPGLGIGTDAVANVLRLGGAMGEVVGQTKLATAATTALTPILGEQAAATAGVAATAAPFVIAFAAIALALKSLTDATSQNVDTINQFAESQRSLNEEIGSGLTSDEAKEKIETLTKTLERQKGTLGDLQGAYDKAEQGLRDATVAGAHVGETFNNVSKIFSGDEQALADQINTQTETTQTLQQQIDSLTGALEDGSLAANDAAEAEKKLAKERSDAALDAADEAGKELQAQQKALSATTEQNEKRLESIDNERAVLEKQIEVLEASGVTSEDVTAKIDSLNGQLELLGKESGFIKDTALDLSRQRDAEKKAKEDAEKAAKAQETYNKAIQNATKALKQSTQDIGTRFAQNLTDNTTKLNRDVTDLTTKYKRDEYDLQLKFNRNERDALKSQVDDLAKIREDANEDELTALREGDFKALFLARQQRDKAAQQENRTDERQAQERQQNLTDAREDLLRNAQQTRSDRLLAYDRQNSDARLAQARDIQQAQLTRQRALQTASEGYNAELKQLGNYLQARLKMQGAAYAAELGQGQPGKATIGMSSASKANPYAGMAIAIRK